MYVETEEKKLLRDTDSYGLVSVDGAGLQRTRSMRARRERQQAIEARMDDCLNRVSRCEDLLEQIAGQIAKLVAKE